MSRPSTVSSAIYVVTIRRGENIEPEAYYMPAPTADIAVLRVRRLAQASNAVILSIRCEDDLQTSIPVEQ